MSDPLRVAVVGSGPAGAYAVAALLDGPVPVRVDVLERLPTPYGLVRYGVAPDHPKIKSVSAVLGRILESPGVRFLGNVNFGTDLTHADLLRFYDAVIYATGAPYERHLGIHGEQLEGSEAGADFVGWYNGHPDFSGHPGFEDHHALDARQVAVVGAGNVALDVARMLATDAEDLTSTDTPDHVIDALRASTVSDVYILARRGPAYAKFTTPELREMAQIPGVDLVVDPAELELDPASEQVVAANRVVRRNVDVMRGWVDRPATGAPRRVHFRFLVRPAEIVGNGHVEGIRIERTVTDAAGAVSGTGRFEELGVQAVFRAVGYLGHALPGLPFDERSGIVPHADGRVVGPDGLLMPGTYVAGWIKRGPTGVIGTNKGDATATVRAVFEDVETLPRAAERDPDAVLNLLRDRGVTYVTWAGWRRIERHELSLGEAQGRPCCKLCDVAAMLEVSGLEA